MSPNDKQQRAPESDIRFVTALDRIAMVLSVVVPALARLSTPILLVLILWRVW